MSGQPLTDNQIACLERVMNLNLLTDWERDFLDDSRARYELFGSRILMSSKQLGILSMLHERYILAYNT